MGGCRLRVGFRWVGLVAILCSVLTWPGADEVTASPPDNCTVSRRLGVCGRTSRPAKPCKEKCKPCRTQACRDRVRARRNGEASLQDSVVLPDPRLTSVVPRRGVAGARSRIGLEIPRVRDPFLDIEGSLAAIHIFVADVYLNVTSRPGDVTFDADFVRLDPQLLGPAPVRVAEAALTLDVVVVPQEQGLTPITVRVRWEARFATSDERPDQTLPTVSTTSETHDYVVVAARGVLGSAG